VPRSPFGPGYTSGGPDDCGAGTESRRPGAWCQQHQLRLSGARRADIERFARDLEARGCARATITRRPCTIAGFYRYAVEEELLDHSPAAHVRRPRLDYESHATGLDRNELGALLVAAGLRRWEPTQRGGSECPIPRAMRLRGVVTLASRLPLEPHR
jgi:hypothetical protein